jgi:hypothetical protein
MATTVGRGGGQSPANVTKHLKGIDFPASKQDLLKHAQQLKAEQVVIDEIKQMDEREYNSMADVMKAFGQEEKVSSSSSQKGQQQAGQGKSQGKSHSKPVHHR